MELGGARARRRGAFWLLPPVAAVLTLLLCSAAHAQSFQVSQAGGATFPQRALLLFGEGIPALTPSNVHIIENGVPVRGVSVQSVKHASAREFGAVVAIDVVPSVASIEQAQRVAQDLSVLRPSAQAFGLVEADNVPPVVLGMTRDATAIQRAFGQRPKINFNGQHLWNAALTAVRLLARQRTNAGTVIVLSDGADRGNPATLDRLVAAAVAAHVRIFTIGIQSGHYFPPILQGMASRTGGEYFHEPTGRVRQIFDKIESALASEYLIRYSSAQAPGQRIPASVRIDGVPGTYDISYTSPVLPNLASGHGPKPNSFWTSKLALLLASGAAALILILGLFAPLLWRGRAPVRARVAAFLPARGEMPQELLEHASNPLFERTERALERTRWWDAFKEEVDIAQIDQSPIELVFLSLAGGIFVGLILYAITGSVLAGLPALIAGPVVVRVVVRQLLRRQQSRFAEQLGEHLQEVASAMRAGRSLVDAFALVGAEASEPTRREFERALSDERLGVPLDEALLPIVERMDNDDMSQVALVAALDRTTGASTAEVLDRVAEGIRENTELQRELRTLTAQVRMSRWILTALPIAILVLISLDDPSYEYPMYHTTFGVVLLILCGLMLAAGSFVMSRLVRIEL